MSDPALEQLATQESPSLSSASLFLHEQLVALRKIPPLLKGQTRFAAHEVAQMVDHISDDPAKLLKPTKRKIATIGLISMAFLAVVYYPGKPEINRQHLIARFQPEVAASYPPKIQPLETKANLAQLPSAETQAAQETQTAEVEKNIDFGQFILGPAYLEVLKDNQEVISKQEDRLRASYPDDPQTEAEEKDPSPRTNQYLENIKTLQPVITEVVADPRFKIPQNEQANYVKLLSAIALTESGGTAEAISPKITKSDTPEDPWWDHAVGAFQVVPGDGKALLKQYGFDGPEFQDYRNYRDPKINTEAGLANFLDQQRQVGEPTLAIAMYYIGTRDISIHALKDYLKTNTFTEFQIDRKTSTAVVDHKTGRPIEKQIRLSVDQIENDFANMQNPPASEYYARKYDINWAKLYSTPAVTANLKASGYSQETLDEVWSYFAAMKILGYI